MNSGRERNDLRGLLDAVLADADWAALNSSLRRQALAEVVATSRRRRRRRRRFWTGAAACAAIVLLVGAEGWWRFPPAAGLTLAKVSGPPQRKPQPQTQRSRVRASSISEAEMLAMFPPGSCVVAEVDGQKELVFFDVNQAQAGFALTP